MIRLDVIVAWSGGKDCALALDRVRASADRIMLLTTFTPRYDRTSIHGVRRELMAEQADALGLPMTTVDIPADTPGTFRDRTLAALDALARDGFDTVVYADIFLEEVRERREDLIGRSDLDARWPLWGEDTADLARTFCDRFSAVTVAADADTLDASFAGRPFDRSFLADLPGGVDPCGEHAGFHTFVRDGPVFSRPVPVRHGDTVTRPVESGRYHFQDLHPPAGRQPLISPTPSSPRGTIPTDRRYVLVGGFPSNFTEHAVMHDIRAVLDAADEEVHAVRLDPDGEENIGELPDPRTVEPAFRRTDLASVHDELDGAGAAETVAIGYCIGGTLLADYQLRAQRDPHLDGFDAAVVLDAPVGIETDHQLVRVEDYPYDDLAGFYDAGIPASQSIDVPRAVVPGTDHLWRDIPDDLGQAVYETVDRMAEGRRPAAAIDMVTGRYDGIEPVGDRAYPADGSDGGPGTGGRP